MDNHGSHCKSCSSATGKRVRRLGVSILESLGVFGILFAMVVQPRLDSVDFVDQRRIFSARINAVMDFRGQLYTGGKNLIKDISGVGAVHQLIQCSL